MPNRPLKKDKQEFMDRYAEQVSFYVSQKQLVSAYITKRRMLYSHFMSMPPDVYFMRYSKGGNDILKKIYDIIVTIQSVKEEMFLLPLTRKDLDDQYYDARMALGRQREGLFDIEEAKKNIQDFLSLYNETVKYYENLLLKLPYSEYKYEHGDFVSFGDRRYIVLEINKETESIRVKEEQIKLRNEDNKFDKNSFYDLFEVWSSTKDYKFGQRDKALDQYIANKLPHWVI